MDALSLQSAAPAAPAAVNTAAAANNSATTDEPASGEAAARPRHFGTLLALQLGAGAANVPIDSAVSGLTLSRVRARWLHPLLPQWLLQSCAPRQPWWPRCRCCRANS